MARSIFDAEFRFETRPSKALFSLAEEDDDGNEPWDVKSRQQPAVGAAAELVPSMELPHVPEEWRRAEEGLVMDAPPLSMPHLHALISEVCCEKQPEDEAARRSRVAAAPIPDFILKFLRFRMTMKQGDAARRASIVARSVAFHRRDSHRINLFSRVVGAHDPLPAEAAQIYTHFMAAMYNPSTERSPGTVQVAAEGGDIRHFCTLQNLLPAISACPVTKEVRAKMSKRAYRLHVEPDPSSAVYRLTDIDVAVDTMLAVWLLHHRAQEANREKRESAGSAASSKATPGSFGDGTSDLLGFPEPPRAATIHTPSSIRTPSPAAPLPADDGAARGARQSRRRRPVITKAVPAPTALAGNGGTGEVLGLWAQLRAVEAAGSVADGVLADLVADVTGEHSATLALGWQRLPEDEMEMLELAATCVQKYLRRWTCLAGFRVLRRATMTLQRHWRGRVGRGVAMQRLMDVSAQLIERVVRGHLARRRVQGIRDDIRRLEQEALEAQHREAATVVIQTAARGWLVRHNQTHSGGGSMTRICICNRPPFGEVISCQVCMDFFHASCVGIKSGKDISSARKGFWTCPDCAAEDRPNESREGRPDGSPKARRSVSVTVPRRPYNPTHRNRAPMAHVLKGMGNSEIASLESKAQKLQPARLSAEKRSKQDKAKQMTPAARAIHDLENGGRDQEPTYWMPAAVPDLIVRFRTVRPMTPLDMREVRQHLRRTKEGVNGRTGDAAQVPPEEESAAALPAVAERDCVDEPKGMAQQLPADMPGEGSLGAAEECGEIDANAAGLSIPGPEQMVTGASQEPLIPIQTLVNQEHVWKSLDLPDLEGSEGGDLGPHQEGEGLLIDADRLHGEDPEDLGNDTGPLEEAKRSEGAVEGNDGPNPSALENEAILAESRALLEKTLSLGPSPLLPTELLTTSKQLGPLELLRTNHDMGLTAGSSATSLAAPKELGPLLTTLPPAPPHEDLLDSQRRHSMLDTLPVLKPLPVLGSPMSKKEASPSQSPSKLQPGLASSGSRASLPPLLQTMEPVTNARKQSGLRRRLDPLDSFDGNSSFKGMDSIVSLSTLERNKAESDAHQSIESSLTGPWLITPRASNTGAALRSSGNEQRATAVTALASTAQPDGLNAEAGPSGVAVELSPGDIRSAGGHIETIQEESDAVLMEEPVVEGLRDADSFDNPVVEDIRVSQQSAKSTATRNSSAYGDEDWEAFEEPRRSKMAIIDDMGPGDQQEALGGHITESVYSHTVAADSGSGGGTEDLSAATTSEHGVREPTALRPESTKGAYEDGNDWEKLNEIRQSRTAEHGVLDGHLMPLDVTAQAEGESESNLDVSRKSKVTIIDEIVTGPHRSAALCGHVTENVYSHTAEDSEGSIAEDRFLAVRAPLDDDSRKSVSIMSEGPRSASGYDEDNWEELEESQRSRSRIPEEKARGGIGLPLHLGAQSVGGSLNDSNVTEDVLEESIAVLQSARSGGAQGRLSGPGSVDDDWEDMEDSRNPHGRAVMEDIELSRSLRFKEGAPSPAVRRSGGAASGGYTDDDWEQIQSSGESRLPQGAATADSPFPLGGPFSLAPLASIPRKPPSGLPPLVSQPFNRKPLFAMKDSPAASVES